MVARCETIGKFVLPVFRSLIARELIDTFKLTQVETAQKLGTTQAAVSQYVNSKRAFKGTEKFGDLLPSLQAMAKETALRLSKNQIHPEQISIDFCKLCPSICAKASDQFDPDFII
jgi:predicted transcriptional regulator